MSIYKRVLKTGHFYEYFNEKDGGSKINFVDGNIDAAFRKIRKNIVGFHIWKVENNRVEAVPRDKYGIFHDDCTYIIYAANTKGCFVNQSTISREVKPNCLPLQSFIHFWLGAKTTAERSGNVAYKVIELDNHLENQSCQYRETQEHESARFMSYFKDGITVYAHDDSDANAQLFQVKNKKSPKCIQRTPINWSHFKSNHIMLLKTSNYIFVWIGRTSSPTERLNAFQYAARMKTASNKTLDIATVDDGYEQSMNDDKKKEWNQYLCLTQRSVHPTDPINTSSNDTVFRLYKCGFTSGKYRIEEVKSSLLEQSDLGDNEHAFIIDGGPMFGVWIWVGKYTDMKDKAEAMRNARGFVKKKNYPSSTAVIRIIEGNEPHEFIGLFPTWTEIDQNGNKTASLLGNFDALTLIQRPHLAAESQLMDDGTGDLTIYRVSTNGDIVEIPKRKNVALFSGDCYLLHYIVTIPDNNLKTGIGANVKHILYLWTGKHCPSEVRKQGESLAHEFSIHLRKSAVEVRVTENKEPPHFLQMFKGHLIIFKGKCIDYDPTGSCCIYPNTYMLKVFGNATYNSKAIQISTKSNEFTSKDCFIIKAGDGSIWIWCGQGSTGDNREVAKSIGSLLGEYSLAIEANEPIELWTFLPEMVKKKLQNATATIPTPTTPTTPQISTITATAATRNGCGGVIELMSVDRNVFVPKCKIELYVCAIDTNDQVTTKQILAFNQNDIVPQDIYLLDGKNFIYLWIGSLSSKHEKSRCWYIIKQYLKSYPIARDMDTPRAIIYQGLEPATFTGYFEQWNPRHWDNYKTYEMERLTFEATFDGNNQPIAAPRMLKHNEEDDSDFDRYPKYPVEILRSEASLLPDTIDPKMKEMHLTHDDFVAIFNMDYFHFAELPNWKQQELKKNHKLF